MTVVMEALYLGGVSTLGLLAITVCTRQPARAFSLAMAFPVGFVLTAILVAVSLVVFGGLGIWSLGFLAAFVLISLFVAIGKLADVRFTNLIWPVTGIWLIAVTLATLQSQASLLVMTFDSFNYAGLSGNITNISDGFSNSYLASMLLSYPALMPFGYAPVGLWGRDVLMAGAPAFALSASSVVAVAVFEAFRDRDILWARAGALIAFAFVLSTPQVRFHAFYIMPNLAMAALVACSGYAIWRLSKNECEDMRGGWVLLLAILLVGVGLARLEGVLFVAVLGLSAFLTQLDRPLRLTIAFAAVTALLLGWLVFLGLNAGDSESILGAGTALAQSLLLLVVLAGMAMATVPAFRKFLSWGILAMPIAMIMALMGLWISSPSKGRATLDNWFQNLTLPLGLWGASYLALGAAAGILVALQTPLRAARPLLLSVVTLTLMTIALGIFREMPYRLGAQDSGNRIMLQIFPLAVMFVGIWASNALMARTGEPAVRVGNVA